VGYDEERKGVVHDASHETSGTATIIRTEKEADENIRTVNFAKGMRLGEVVVRV
jgi:hypothetical protein